MWATSDSALDIPRLIFDISEMLHRFISWVFPFVAVAVAVVCLTWWFGRDPAAGLKEHVPGLDDPLGLRKIQKKNVFQISIRNYLKILLRGISIIKLAQLLPIWLQV